MAPSGCAIAPARSRIQRSPVLIGYCVISKEDWHGRSAPIGQASTRQVPKSEFVLMAVPPTGNGGRSTNTFPFLLDGLTTGTANGCPGRERAFSVDCVGAKGTTA